MDIRWKMNEIMSRVRPEEWERIIFMPSEVRLKFFLKIYKIRAPKIHSLALQLYTGDSKSRGQEGFLLKVSRGA